MSTKNKPIRTLRDGNIKAAIWQNGSENTFYSVTFSRSYKDDGGNYHDADSFSGSDLLKLAHLAGHAYDAIAKLRAEDRKTDGGCAMSAPDTKAAMIAVLNDAFRSSPVPLGIPGQKLITRGIADLPEADQLTIWQQVQSFDSFTEDNDPHWEHDFGAFDHPNAGKIFWKIDYYADASCEFGSEAPEDPARCYRVLTIMLAHEY